jgi:enoyl-CoA hydratase/carnithine racemase
VSSLLRAQRNGAVLRLTLADAASRNSLSEAMLAQLTELITGVGSDVRVIILAAEGLAFCSGHNLKELTAHRADNDLGASYFKVLFDQCAGLMLAITRQRRPVIAEVNGLASAAGCQLVATCDLAYAAPAASFCTPGVNIGLFCSTPMVALSRAVSAKQAMAMLLTGDVISAETARNIGLVNDVVPAAELSEFVDALALRIATKSAAAIGYGKRAFYEQREVALPQAYELTSAIMVQNMLDGAACEGLDAFIAKRKPQWPETQ